MALHPRKRCLSMLHASDALPNRFISRKSPRRSPTAHFIASGAAIRKGLPLHSSNEHVPCAARVDHSIPVLHGEDREFWAGILDQVKDKRAQEMLSSVIMDNVVGIQPLERRRQAMAYLDLVKKVKEEHPR